MIILPEGVETIYARADSGFYCAEAVEAYEKAGVKFIISARKTARLIDELKAAEWTGSPKTDADGQSSGTSRRAGAKPIGALLCATRRRRRSPRRRSPNRISCSTRRSTATAYSPPT
jgi:hypothetical protein